MLDYVAKLWEKIEEDYEFMDMDDMKSYLQDVDRCLVTLRINPETIGITDKRMFDIFQKWNEHKGIESIELRLENIEDGLEKHRLEILLKGLKDGSIKTFGDLVNLEKEIKQSKQD